VAQSSRDLVGLRGGSLGKHGPGKAEEQAQRSSPRIRDLMACRAAALWAYGAGLVCSAGYSFSVSWCGEAFHQLGVQSANVSALPGALPQPSVSPASQQSSWFMELRRSAAVSQSPYWISLIFTFMTKNCFQQFFPSSI
jgi:hypothetical protein